MATMFSFYSRECSSSSPDLITADGDTPKRQRSPQEQAQHVLRSKRLRLALESDLTDENIAEASLGENAFYSNDIWIQDPNLGKQH